MFDRKKLKKEARISVKNNWKNCIIVCILFSLLIGGPLIKINKEFNFDLRINLKDIKLDGKNNSDIVNNFIVGLRGNKPIPNTILNGATKGVIGTLINNISMSGSFLFGILNALNEFLFKDRIWAGTIIIIGVILTIMYWIFVSNVLKVGIKRFFLENRSYKKAKKSRLFYPYKVQKGKHIAFVMFIKNIKLLLWSFTIVGGVIKYYSYLLVPYILAENPNIKANDALKLSEKMMKGYKFAAFKLDLSFIGFRVLDIITANISNSFITRPYINATKANLYMFLRNKNKEYLFDELLDVNRINGEYPVKKSLIKEKENPKWMNLDYERKYHLDELILLFFLFSFVGWLWEVMLHLFRSGVFVNRGTIHGPWLPIYGAGAVVILFVLRKYRNNPCLYFLLSMVITGVIEYGTSMYLEWVHNLSWWDYTGYFLNINGRVCLEGLIFFATGCMVGTYIIAPLAVNFFDKIKPHFKKIICIILIIIFSLDFYYSSKHPNIGKGITHEIKEKKTIKY